MSFKRKRESNHSKDVTAKKPFHWSQSLLAAMNDPELRIEEDDKVVVIKDKYPKAKHHYLVLCKENIPSLKATNSSHLDLLKHMEQKGKEITKRLSPETNFLYGYHSVPSLSRLHLHVISKDFDSTCLKTKKHWNSFTTPFFLHSKKILKQLEESGSINILPPKEAEDLLKGPLRCHVCQKEEPTIPKLKLHVKKRRLSVVGKRYMYHVCQKKGEHAIPSFM